MQLFWSLMRLKICGSATLGSMNTLTVVYNALPNLLRGENKIGHT